MVTFPKVFVAATICSAFVGVTTTMALTPMSSARLSTFGSNVYGSSSGSKLSTLHAQRRSARRPAAAPAATMVGLGALKWAAALPTMYGLMSVNEYFTHRYYQHAEYNKDKFFQALAKTFNLPKRIRGGGHVEHHAETYDDMLLKTDDPQWMKSAAAKSLSDDPWRGTAFTWKVTGQMTIQMLFTTLPVYMGILKFSLLQTAAILMPCMLLHAFVWNALHPNMHGLPEVPLRFGAPSSVLAPLRKTWYFRYLYQVRKP